MFMGEVIEPPQQPKEWEVLVLAEEDVNEAKINLGCQIQESERLTEEGLSIVDGEQRLGKDHSTIVIQADHSYIACLLSTFSPCHRRLTFFSPRPRSYSSWQVSNK